MMVDWTQVLIAAITTAGSVASGFFAWRARRSAKHASSSADRAREASERPPVGFVSLVPPSDGERR